MYNTSGATLRADLNAFVEEGAGIRDNFIADLLMPQIGVEAQSGQYPYISLTNGMLIDAGSTDRAPGASYGQVSRAWSSDTYTCQDRGLEEPIDDTVSKDLGRFGIGLEMASAGWVLRNMKITAEKRCAAIIHAAGSWVGAVNSVVAYTNANIATISFVEDVIAAVRRVRAVGGAPDTIVMSGTVMDRISRATLVQNAVRGNRPTDSIIQMNAQAIADVFKTQGIRQCLVGESYYNSAKKGQTAVATAVWGNTYVWIGSCAGGDISAGGAARTFVWNAEGGLYVTETYRNEPIRSNVVRVRQNTIEKVIRWNEGTLITTQYS
jgi:hypothetical protein